MMFARFSSPAIRSLDCPPFCPQCGDDWARIREMSRLPEFCPRCGSPVTGVNFDPLRARVYGVVRVNRRTKLVVRSGILGVGVISLIMGALLSYSGWISTENLDLIQLWVSRVSGPVLIIQGLFYGWIPFRRPVAAPVISLDRSRMRSTKELSGK